MPDKNTNIQQKPQSNDSDASRIVDKILDAQNILVALSSDPSVDELASAIGLSLYLDRFGKRATAIFSGKIPNALEFLKPENTFEKTADTLQDFVIAISKEKADHLRYKLDGDFVRIFITPYRSRISEDDLEFSYGDFNIDLVIALNVSNGVDLDVALREYGRIMHDATVINVTTGNPGKFGEIEWSNNSSSSVSEMLSRLIVENIPDQPLKNDEATAFLTGIVAATDKFSNAATTAETMQVAAELMKFGADQQLISENITEKVSNQSVADVDEEKPNSENTSLDISHDEEEPKEAPEESTPESEDSEQNITKEPEEPAPEPEAPEEPANLEEDLKAAAESLANTGAEVTPEPKEEPLSIRSEEKRIEPLADFKEEPVVEEEKNKYGQMLEDALAEAANPAASATPQVATEPEINGVPDIDYAKIENNEGILTPPTPESIVQTSVPAPTIAPEPIPAEMMPPVSAPEPVVSEPTISTAEPVTPAPAIAPEPIPAEMMPPTSPEPEGASSAFKIPGM